MIVSMTGFDPSAVDATGRVLAGEDADAQEGLEVGLEEPLEVPLRIKGLSADSGSA